MRTSPAAHQDPGLQPERTLLSWTRTALLLVVVAGFLLRWAPYHGTAVLVLFAAALAVGAAITLTHRRRLAGSTWGIAEERYPPAIGSIAALTLALVVLGASALVFLLVT